MLARMALIMIPLDKYQGNLEPLVPDALNIPSMMRGAALPVFSSLIKNPIKIHCIHSGWYFVRDLKIPVAQRCCDNDLVCSYGENACNYPVTRRSKNNDGTICISWKTSIPSYKNTGRLE